MDPGSGGRAVIPDPVKSLLKEDNRSEKTYLAQRLVLLDADFLLKLFFYVSRLLFFKCDRLRVSAPPPNHLNTTHLCDNPRPFSGWNSQFCHLASGMQGHNQWPPKYLSTVGWCLEFLHGHVISAPWARREASVAAGRSCM